MVSNGVSTSTDLPIDNTNISTAPPMVIPSSPPVPRTTTLPILHMPPPTIPTSLQRFPYSIIPSLPINSSMPLPPYQSQFATSSPSSSAISPSPPPPPPPFTQLNHAHHYISIKLTNTNHLHWHTQLAPFLEGHDLFGYVYGSIPCPPSHIEDASFYHSQSGI
ncbi:hypothetical protein LIER_28424 [Lithospermum erythrorhizon]|uniref:Uncharacterized protein n=1 Tax=Lithospermum erythrorhizon TaxID=34254 RepID=A0AAV3RLM6_LITER